MVFPGVFALVIGVGMIGQWAASYFAKQIPELITEPIRIGFHLAGEMITALMLIAAGIGLLAGAPWAGWVFLVGMGMLFYTAIVSPGYFAQQGKWIWVLIFGVMIVVGVFAIRAVLVNGGI